MESYQKVFFSSKVSIRDVRFIENLIYWFSDKNVLIIGLLVNLTLEKK